MPDLKGRSFGRGAWVHPQTECLRRLIPSLQRSFRAPVVTTGPEALALLRAAAEHRAWQMLGDGRRQRLLVGGSDVTARAWSAGQLSLVLVASDADAAAKLTFVSEAVSLGQARVWGTKSALGALFGRPEIGVVGLTDRGLAQRLFGAIAMALLVPGAPNDGAIPALDS